MLVDLCPASELPDGTMRYFEIIGCDYVVANLAGTYYALDAGCTSGWFNLAEGTLDRERKVVLCQDCKSAFELETGKPIEGPATFPLRTYEVSVVDGNLVVDTRD